MRHRFLPCTAGEQQDFPLRVLAPHRGLESIGSVLRLWFPTILGSRDFPRGADCLTSGSILVSKQGVRLVSLHKQALLHMQLIVTYGVFQDHRLIRHDRRRRLFFRAGSFGQSAALTVANLLFSIRSSTVGRACHQLNCTLQGLF